MTLQTRDPTLILSATDLSKGYDLPWLSKRFQKEKSSLDSSLDDSATSRRLEILRGVDFKLHEGEIVAISGASGEGKSTLLHILGLLDHPSSGKVEFPLWSDESENQIRSNHLGFVFQQFHLLEDLSALDNVLLPIRIGQSEKRPDGTSSILIGRATTRERALYWLDRVGLGKRVDHPASRLSGGEKQRCALARALITEPSILLADEPTGNLDHDNAQNLADLLLELVREHKRALILVTHDSKLADRAERCLILERGKLQAGP